MTERSLNNIPYAVKTSIKENIEKIRNYLEKNGESKASDIAEYIGLSPARTRVLLNEMEEVVTIGKNRNRTYRLKQEVFAMLRPTANAVKAKENF